MPIGRMGEQHGRDIFVVELAVLHATEQAIGEAPAGRNRNRCELEFADDIADCIDAGYIGLLVCVDRDVSACVDRYAGCTQIEAIGICLAPDCPQAGRPGLRAFRRPPA